MPPEDIKQAKIDGSYLKLLKRLQRFPLLIIDDFGLHPFDNVTRQALMDLINRKLQSFGLVPLNTEESEHKRIITNRVVDIYQAPINNMVLNLELARRRLRSDISDDWFHDPLMYVDLLKKDYLFSQFKKHFYKNNYTVERWNLFYVPKKKLSHRKAYIGSFKDRIIYLALVGELAYKLDEAMIPTTYSARYNKYDKNNLILNGVEQWKKLKNQLAFEAKTKTNKDEYKHGCLIEVDLLNFYDNINIQLLTKKIKRVCSSTNELLVANQLELFLLGLTEQKVGLPQNSDASSLIATFYLNEVDVYMSNQCPSYFRFMDDIRIFCKDKYQARRLLQLLEFELKRCGLSINSQKTRILELVDFETNKDSEFYRKSYDIYDIDVSKLGRLRNSTDSNNRNEAFHSCLIFLERLITCDDILSDKESSRKLFFILTTLKFLVNKNFKLTNDHFIELMKKTLELLQDNPWMTFQIISVLNLLNADLIISDFLDKLKIFVLDTRFNTYTYQSYQIWLLLANHKCEDKDLRQYALNQIECNDQTNEPTIAAMMIYMCSIDSNFLRVVNRFHLEGRFKQSYFQSRLSLIAQRKLDISLISPEMIHSTLKKSPIYTNSYKNKDLVLSPTTFSQSGKFIIDQLYSL